MNQDLQSNIWRLFPDSFAKKASRGKWRDYKYLKFIADKIALAVHHGNARIIVSLPPRHGKSEFCSVWLPIWFLEMYSDKRIILASHSAELASTFGRKVRNELETNEMMSVKIAQDSSAAHRFDTVKGGGMISAGVGGPITGKGAHLFLIDDPYKDMAQAMSDTYRARIQDWYESVARSRLEPNGSMIIIMTRWHESDLAGWLIKQGGWDEIKMPAINEKNEPLCPERYDRFALEQIKKEVGSRTWNALYQQNPQPVEGGLFKRNWWKFYRETPHFTRKIQLWDCAQKVGITNDYSVCATWGETQNGYYLIDLWRSKVEAPQLEQAARNLYAKHLPNVVVIEDKSSGSSLIQSLKQNSTLPVIAYDPKSRDKEVRASAATPTVEAGKCFLPMGAPWVEDFISEHERFPNVEHDDQVDTTSMAVEFLRQQFAIPRVRVL